jgi:hypothetical protein
MRKVLSVARVFDAAADSTHDAFTCRGVVDASGNRPAVFDESNRDTPLGDAVDELAGAIDRIDDPYPSSVEAVQGVNGLLREPSLTVGWKDAHENSVHGEVCLCQRVATRLQRGFDRSRRELLENAYRLIECGIDPREILGVAHFDSW